MDHSRYTSLFLADARDHLARAGALLLDWEQNPGSPAPVDELFRAFHSVKGSAATMGYTPVAELAHAAEHLLGVIREQRLAASRAVIGLLLRAVDVLEQGVEAVVTGGAVPDAPALSQALDRMVASAAPLAAEPGREPVAPPTPARRPAAAPSRARPARSVRIEPARLDLLLQRAGELVVATNQLDAVAASVRLPALEGVTGQLGSLVRRMHAGVLQARLAPVEELFSRFPRIVRDLGDSLDRLVRLEIKAGGIELDRGMLEDLVDPLVHLVRNAVDHGIEPVSERLAANKPAEGLLTLRAERLRDSVTLGLADDGRGIDRETVARRAEAQGLRRPGAPPPDDDELLGLLARPGFTLKGQVTAVSGRGVGMDIVVSAVRALGGQVALSTTRGRGTEVRLTLPLTTAVQRVLLISAGGDRYAIPFRMIREAVAPNGAVGTVTAGSRYSFRDESLPFVDLTTTLGREIAAGARRPVLVVAWGARQGAVAVDALLGQLDVLIERVEAPAGLPAWVSGATILSDGSPAFVLDPTALF